MRRKFSVKYIQFMIKNIRNSPTTAPEAPPKEPDKTTPLPPRRSLPIEKPDDHPAPPQRCDPNEPFETCNLPSKY